MTLFLQQIVNGLVIGSTYALVALGFGLVFSVMRVINMAHPDFVMVGAYVAGVVLTALEGSEGHGYAGLVGVGAFLLAALAASAAGGVSGIAVEKLVLRRLRASYILIPFIATAGVGVFLESGAIRIFGSDPKLVPSALKANNVTVGGVTLTTPQLLTIVSAVLMMAVVTVYVRRTRLGLASRALAERPEAAMVCGVNVTRVSQITIGLASALAGVAGAAVGTLYNSAAPDMGLLYGLKAFVCMLVAGNRHIEGIMAVGLFLGVIEALITGYVSPAYKDAVAFGLLLAILVFRPRGLFGSYE